MHIHIDLNNIFVNRKSTSSSRSLTIQYHCNNRFIETGKNKSNRLINKKTCYVPITGKNVQAGINQELSFAGKSKMQFYLRGNAVMNIKYSGLLMGLGYIVGGNNEREMMF